LDYTDFLVGLHRLDGITQIFVGITQIGGGFFTDFFVELHRLDGITQIFGGITQIEEDFSRIVYFS
jgi:hypothetical protein